MKNTLNFTHSLRLISAGTALVLGLATNGLTGEKPNQTTTYDTSQRSLPIAPAIKRP